MNPREQYPELQKLRWDLIAGEVAFDRPESVLGIAATGAESGCPMGARICMRCKGVWPLLSCTNCRGANFKPGMNAAGVAGLFCFGCDRGFASWTCESCGCDNAIRKSLGLRSPSSASGIIGCLVVVVLVVVAFLVYAAWLT